MMTDEDTPDSKHINTQNSPDVADKKGQMLVIYLPEGSVIVDRTDVNLSTVPHASVEQIVPTVQEKIVQPVVENISVEQPQPTLEEVVQLAVAEILRIMGHASNPILFADYPAPATKIPTPNIAAAPPSTGRQVHVRRRRKTNWVHGVNTLFAAYLLVIAIVPSLLSSAFGVAIYASMVSHPDVLISQGDLTISQVLPASQIQAHDVLLVRDSNTWLMDDREVISNTTSGALSTIATASIGGSAVDKTYVLANDARSYKISRVIPKLGYVPIILSSTFVKVLGGLFILILNLMVYLRRSRRRRLETVIR